MTSSSEGVNTLGVALTIGIICVLAIFTNIFVIIVTCNKTERFKYTTGLYILNLAVSDIILGAITMPLILLDANIPEFSKNDVECKLKMALPLFNIYSSICTMLVMSFDRLRVMVRGATTPKNHALMAILFTWVLSLVLTAPQFYEYSLVEKWEEKENETELVCSSAGKDPIFIRTYAALVLVLAYLVPLVLLTKNYMHVIIFVVKKSGQIEGQVSRAKLRVLRTGVTITVVFVCLWLPFFVLFTIEEVTGTDDSSKFSSTPHVVKQVFIALSSISNPVIYMFSMQEYRTAVLRFLLPARCCVIKVQPMGNGDTDAQRAESEQAQQRSKPSGAVPCDSPRGENGTQGPLPTRSSLPLMPRAAQGIDTSKTGIVA